MNVFSQSATTASPRNSEAFTLFDAHALRKACVVRSPVAAYLPHHPRDLHLSSRVPRCRGVPGDAAPIDLYRNATHDAPCVNPAVSRPHTAQRSLTNEIRHFTHGKFPRHISHPHSTPPPAAPIQNSSYRNWRGRVHTGRVTHCVRVPAVLELCFPAQGLNARHIKCESDLQSSLQPQDLPLKLVTNNT